MNTINEFIGQRIRKLRKKHRFSQEQLAQMIGSVQTTLSSYETGSRNIDAKELWMLAKTLGEPINSFFPDMDNKADVPEPSKEFKLHVLEHESQVLIRLDFFQMLQLYEQTNNWFNETQKLREAIVLAYNRGLDDGTKAST